MTEVPEQPSLTDGVVTIRPWRDDDAGAVNRSPRQDAEDRSVVDFVVEADGRNVGGVALRSADADRGAASWWLHAGARGNGYATRALRLLLEYAFEQRGLLRVEAEVGADNTRSQRVATRSGMRREGVRRYAPGMADSSDATDVVYARLADDPPITEPGKLRALLNSFLPRKRAIGQMLIRDRAGRVLLCGLTYKRDHDLPGGVVEVGESPRLAVAREIEEELGLSVPAGRLLLTDWLPPWGGWDDAVCLVFDGGVHDAELLDDVIRQEREIASVAFATLEDVDARAADFTARRVRAAIAALDGGSAYTESGRA